MTAQLQQPNSQYLIELMERPFGNKANCGNMLMSGNDVAVPTSILCHAAILAVSSYYAIMHDVAPNVRYDNSVVNKYECYEYG